MIMDEEVFAVIIAIAVVASAVGIAFVWRSGGEPFTAIAILGLYPKTVVLGRNISLCLFIYNNMFKPIAYEVRYKIALNVSQLPTNTSPSNTETLCTWTGVLGHGENATFPITVSIPPNKELVGRNISLVFELWIFDPYKGVWVYSGRWVHLWVRVVE